MSKLCGREVCDPRAYLGKLNDLASQLSDKSRRPYLEIIITIKWLNGTKIFYMQHDTVLYDLKKDMQCQPNGADHSPQVPSF